MLKPNFFIIGAPKCGTTALGGYLGRHPNIFFSVPKEPWYFSFDFKGVLKRSLEDYLALFAAADPAIHQAVGEGSTSYLFSRRAVPEILRFNPDAKFIVMLRNPVEIVQALHSQRIFNVWENIKDFEKAWRAEESRKKGKNLPLIYFDDKDLLYSDWGKLGDQLERLYASVAKDRVKVIIFEDFVADTKKVYEDTVAFLGVPADGRTEFPRINENKSVRSVGFQKALAIMGHLWPKVKIKTGFNLKFGVMTKLIGWNSFFSSRKPISREFELELKNFYHEDVQKLSRILGRDLSHWVSASPARKNGAVGP